MLEATKMTIDETTNSDRLQANETRPIEVTKLDRSPLNVRRTDKAAALDELKASILAHGLMQNLVVTANGHGTYHVIAGGRRLEAIRALMQEGKLPADHAVPCQVVDEERAAELSLAENVVRVAMHPADEFEAYAALAENGHDAAAIAERFGVTKKHVLQRLQLARVAPELLEEHREGKLVLESLMAFTITDDRTRQLSVYRSLKGWQVGSAEHIRGLLTETMVGSESKFAVFVGREAYEGAGGRVRSDLFGEEVYFEDPELLHRLVAEKLEGVRAVLEAEGWGWVEVHPERDYQFAHQCGRLRATRAELPPELVAEREKLEAELQALEEAEESEEELPEDHYERQDRAEELLAEVEERLKEFDRYDPEQMKTAGCYVSIAHDGPLSIERGLVRKQDQKALGAATGEPKAAKPKDQLPMSLRHDLEAYRLQVARCEIAANADIAVDLLVFDAACEILSTRRPADGPDVRFHEQTAAPTADGETKASVRFARIEQALPREWLEAKTGAERFEGFRALPEGDKRSILAYCVASTLRPGLAPTTPKDRTAYDVALALTGADVAAYWRPSKASYLGRLTREQLLGIGKELLGKVWAAKRADQKKRQLVDALDSAFAAPEESGATPEQVARLKSWLPEGVTFGGAVASKPAKVKAKPSRQGSKAA
jgi:ParB family chromosome partitioning protein